MHYLKDKVKKKQQRRTAFQYSFSKYCDVRYKIYSIEETEYVKN